MSWKDAKAFCRWLTEKERAEGRLRLDQEYRLPTDLEWSVAAGLPTESGSTPKERDGKIKGVYPWGRQWPPPAGAGNFPGEEAKPANWPKDYAGVIRGCNDGYPRTSPVGSFKPNLFGLYDVGGNVWEWCEDWYDSDQKHHVARGGSWSFCFSLDDLLSSKRCIYSDPDLRNSANGFRCVLVARLLSLPLPPTLPPSKQPPQQADSSAPLAVPEQRIPAQLTSDYRNFLAVFESEAGQGSGFVANIKGQRYLLGNLSVLAGIKGTVFRLLDRTPLEIGAASVAVGRDILVFGLTNGGMAVPVVESLVDETTFGDPVVVPTNPDAEGVVRFSEGTIVGMGPDLVEVDAHFAATNIGSPIIHLRSGKVIGLTAYVKSGKDVVRNFGYRLDNVQAWQQVNWNLFRAEAAALKKMEEEVVDGRERVDADQAKLKFKYDYFKRKLASQTLRRLRLSRSDMVFLPSLSSLASVHSPVSGLGTSAQLMRNYRSGLVFFATERGQGSGFLGSLKGHKYLVTNIHVLAGIKGAVFKLLDNSLVKVGAASVAADHDIMVLGVTEGGTAIPVAESVDKEAAIGDSVVVLGNAEGEGVVNLLEGKIVNIEPDRIEVDAPFASGNSGSPIIHLRSGKIIGIATYARKEKVYHSKDYWTYGKERRFGYRLDSVRQWQQIDWNRFYAEAEVMSKIRQATLELSELVKALITRGWASIVCETPAIRNALKTFRGSRHTRQDYDTLMSSLRVACLNDVHQAGAWFMYECFRVELSKEWPKREEIASLIDKAMQN